MHVLVAEHDIQTARLLESLFGRWKYDHATTRDVNETWAALYDRSAPQIMILDWMMPEMDGVRCIQKIRASKDAPYVYIIVLTEQDRKQDIVDGLAAGADDYTTKPCDARELRVRLRAGQRILELQQELTQSQQALATQASRDPLTGFWSASVVTELLQGELNRARRGRLSLSVILASIRDLVHIHETFGSVIYDALVREAAQKIKHSVRSYDIIARYREGEFLMVLPGCDNVRAQLVGERIQQLLCDEPLHTPEHALTLQVDLGVATTGEEPTPDAGRLVRAALTALERTRSSSLLPS